MSQLIENLAKLLGAFGPNLLEGLNQPNPGPEAPKYERSTGRVGSYEFIPRSIRAVQLLPENFTDAMLFMHEAGLSFGYCARTDAEFSHFHVKDEAGNTQNWVVGEWLVVQFETGHPEFAVDTVADDNFRRQVRPVQFVKSFQPDNFGTGDYRDDPIQTFGHSAQADLDAEREAGL